MKAATRQAWNLETWTHPLNGSAQIAHKFNGHRHIVMISFPDGRTETYREHAEVETAREHWRMARRILAAWGYSTRG